MAAIVAQSLPGTTATLTFFDSYPPMAPTAANRALLATLNGVNRDLGLPEMPEFDPAKRSSLPDLLRAFRAQRPSTSLLTRLLRRPA